MERFWEEQRVGEEAAVGDDARVPGDHYADDGEAIERATRCFRFLRSVPILFEIDDTTLWELARIAEPSEFDAGARILAEDEQEPERSQRFYIIRSGTADVVRRGRSGAERVVARLATGSYFGELGLLTDQARNATVRVHGTAPLVVYGFDAMTFHRRIAEHVLVFRLLRERSRSGLRSVDQAGGGRGRLRIKQLALLDHLPQRDLEYVLDHAKQQAHAAGETIISQGEPGDRFYVVLDGSVRVVRDDAELAEIRAGGFFGETALLLDMPRTATVETTSATVTWSITRSAFQRLVGGYLLSNPRTQDEIVRRMRTALPPGSADQG